MYLFVAILGLKLLLIKKNVIVKVIYMKILIVLIITFITSHTYSFDLKLDLEGLVTP